MKYIYSRFSQSLEMQHNAVSHPTLQAQLSICTELWPAGDNDSSRETLSTVGLGSQRRLASPIRIRGLGNHHLAFTDVCLYHSCRKLIIPMEELWDHERLVKLKLADLRFSNYCWDLSGLHADAEENCTQKWKAWQYYSPTEVSVGSHGMAQDSTKGICLCWIYGSG